MQTSCWLILLQAVLLVPPLGKMPRCPSLGSGDMAGVLVKLHLGVRPIGSTGDPGGQFPNHLLHTGNPGLTGVHPYGRKTILPISCSLLALTETRRKAMSLQNFSSSPQAFKPVREESSDQVTDMIWNCCNGGQMFRHPQSDARSFPN